jgi:hypothetical protein
MTRRLDEIPKLDYKKGIAESLTQKFHFAFETIANYKCGQFKWKVFVEKILIFSKKNCKNNL